jgi:hypothetical protein
VGVALGLALTRQRDLARDGIAAKVTTGSFCSSGRCVAQHRGVRPQPQPLALAGRTSRRHRWPVP